MPPFYRLPLPATNFRRCRAFEIHLSSRMLTFHVAVPILSFINLHAKLSTYFSAASYATDKTVYEDIWFIRLRNRDSSQRGS